LELELDNLEELFKYVLFGVCSGMMESEYLLVFSKTYIEQAQFSQLAHEMEVACAKSNVSPT
jgi:hypothetical protein